jgi:hypothetical protein
MVRGVVNSGIYLLETTMITLLSQTISAFHPHSAIMPESAARATKLATRVVLTSLKVLKRARVRTCVRMGCVLHVDRMVCSAAQKGWKIVWKILWKSMQAPLAMMGLTACKVCVNTVANRTLRAVKLEKVRHAS